MRRALRVRRLAMEKKRRRRVLVVIARSPKPGRVVQQVSRNRIRGSPVSSCSLVA